MGLSNPPENRKCNIVLLFLLFFYEAIINETHKKATKLTTNLMKFGLHHLKRDFKIHLKKNQ